MGISLCIYSPRSRYEYSKESKIPYTYVLIDSWWYFKGHQAGVTDWAPMPRDFPTGLNATSRLHRTTNWGMQAHNRYWSDQNIYAKQNGGDYEFLIQNGSGAVPITQRFWDDFFAQSKEIIANLEVYEQDWLGEF
jgi:hypothetical protein